MSGTKPVDGAIELLPELHLSRVRVCVPYELRDGPPIVLQNTKVIHISASLIHAGPQNFKSLHLIQHAIKVQRNGRRHPFQTAMVEIEHLLVPFEPPD